MFCTQIELFYLESAHTHTADGRAAMQLEKARNRTTDFLIGRRLLYLLIHSPPPHVCVYVLLTYRGSREVFTSVKHMYTLQTSSSVKPHATCSSSTQLFLVAVAIKHR